jgi:hypothetical protein
MLTVILNPEGKEIQRRKDAGKSKSSFGLGVFGIIVNTEIEEDAGYKDRGIANPSFQMRVFDVRPNRAHYSYHRLWNT